MMGAPTVSVVLKGYPRLSETFIAQEIRGLEQRGLNLIIHSLRHPTDPDIHPIHREILAPVNYLPEYLYREPLRVLRAASAVRGRPGFSKALRTWWRDLVQDFTPNRVRRFGQAMVLAHELPDSVSHLYAHFMHTPASVTRYAAMITGLGWSCSAHAKDIWTSPDWEKAEKLADCQWLVTCTQTNRDHLAALAPQEDRVDLVYHGLDLERFSPPEGKSEKGDATAVTILSVGRAVEKKGYDDLLDALARLPGELPWRFVHIGGGVLQDRLRKRALKLGISDRISWLGLQSQEEVLRHYRSAHLFALACRVARNGDRDGLPNVLMEAMSQELPVVATAVSAIPELISSQEVGLLVPPGDPEAMAGALEKMITDGDLRQALGRAGALHVRSVFGCQAGLDRLVEKFGPVASP